MALLLMGDRAKEREARTCVCVCVRPQKQNITHVAQTDFEDGKQNLRLLIDFT